MQIFMWQFSGDYEAFFDSLIYDKKDRGGGGIEASKVQTTAEGVFEV